jgi:hypothetical protein
MNGRDRVVRGSMSWPLDRGLSLRATRGALTAEADIAAGAKLWPTAGPRVHQSILDLSRAQQ